MPTGEFEGNVSYVTGALLQSCVAEIKGVVFVRKQATHSLASSVSLILFCPSSNTIVPFYFDDYSPYVVPSVNL